MASAVLTPGRVTTPGDRRVTLSAPLTPHTRSSESEGRQTPQDRPPTRGRMTPKSPSNDRLTPMPDYMHPIVKSAARRWKKLHEDHMMQKLVERRNQKKQLNQYTREEAKKLARKIPIEVLAKEWLKDSKATVETRAFLLDKVLPTLILGVEKLLIEVDKKSLIDGKEPEYFNPVNFLGQYLMRNNPRYSNFSEASPYIRGLREVNEELRTQLFDQEENRLAKIKAEAKKKREERERQENLRILEKQRREELLRAQFKEWNVETLSDTKIELALLQNALLSFAEIAEHYPSELRLAAKFSHELEPTDDTGRLLSVKEFVEYLTMFIEDMSSEVFDQFMVHLSHCARANRSHTECEQRRDVLSQLFKSCDNTGVGLLDRHRILNLFEMYWDKARETIKATLRNPRKWPVVEVEEVDSNYDSEDESDRQNPKFFNNNLDVTEETKAGNKGKDSPRRSPAQEEGITEDGTSEEQEKCAAQEVETNEEDKQEEEKDQVPAEEGETENPATTDSQSEVQEGETKEAPPEGTSELTEEDNNDKAEEQAGETAENSSAPAETAEEEVLEDQGDKNEEGDNEQDEDGTVEAGETTEDDGDPELSKLAESGKTRPRTQMTQQSKVSFAEGTFFEREKALLTSHSSRSQSQASAFDENLLNMSQFVMVTETFLGDHPEMATFNNLTRFIKEGYMETEEERMQRFIKARRDALSAKRRALLNSLFEMWDNDGSGFLDFDEVQTVMKKYKDGQEVQAVLAGAKEFSEAKKEFRTRSRHHDTRLSKREFREYVFKVIDNMAQSDSMAFDQFVEYLLGSVERSYAERVRGEARKKWLQQIIKAAETSGASMEPVYKAVFQALYKDAETHGSGKMISANVAMLESNDVAPHHGKLLLRYMASTTEDAPYLLGKVLYRDMKGISFASVESGKPIHVPRVGNHGNIMFWNTDRKPEQREGSFIVVPLKDKKKCVFGLLGIDTLNDPHSRAIFVTHEIQFFQGITKAFSIAYHHVDLRRKTMRISESGISWIHRRTPHIREITLYMVEPDGKGQDYLLRKMMYTDHKGAAMVIKTPPKLERKDNLFRDYLFKCVDNSESVTADAYGERHLAIPLRDDQGLAIVTIDISIGDLKVLPKVENRDVMKMLKLLQTAYKEIFRESRDGEEPTIIEGVEHLDDAARTEILFDRLMLAELRENVAKLDAESYAELKSYQEPPEVIHQVVKAVLSIFYPQKALDGEFDSYSNCKQYMSSTLNQQILEYDPTGGNADTSIPTDLINKYLDAVPHGAVSKHGSIPAQFLYNWVFVCVSLIEHSRKMKASRSQQSETPPNTAKPEEALETVATPTDQMGLEDLVAAPEQNQAAPPSPPQKAVTQESV